jgi:hypothetical protein
MKKKGVQISIFVVFIIAALVGVFSYSHHMASPTNASCTVDNCPSKIHTTDSGKTFTYRITSRFSVFIDATNPILTCLPSGIIGTISNLPSSIPRETSFWFEGLKAGTCTLGSGDFKATIIIIDSRAPTSGVREYQSKTLGLSFAYDASKASVQEHENIVTVYPNNTDSSLGQKVIRFTKIPTENLEQSIRRQILPNYSKNNCVVQITQSNKYQGGYFQAEISYPEGTSGPTWTNAAVCNKDYDKTNGVRFFLYDSNHPDRFYFFDIGQYSIPADNQVSWQDTVHIL